MFEQNPKREKSFAAAKKILQQKLDSKSAELEDSRMILINMLADIDVFRQKAAQEVKKTEAIIANFTDGLLMFDAKGRISLVNQQAEKFLKIRKAVLLGKTAEEISGLPQLKFLAPFLGESTQSVKREAVPQGEMILEISASAVKKDKKNLGVLIVLHDVTREKMIERMKTEFVSLAAHQLRTPLSAAKWSLRMLLDGEFGQLNKQQEDSLKITYESNERIICLINDLLDITSIEEGKYLKNFVTVDMKDIIWSVLNVFKKESVEKKIDLNFRWQGKGASKITADAEKVKLALENILENAIRYSPMGGEVAVFLNGGNKKIKVDISDAGIGIPKHQQNRVFDKFFRATNAVKTETMGTGLGLFLAKNIIEAHGGRIWFESEENQGTQFHFILPVKPKVA